MLDTYSIAINIGKMIKIVLNTNFSQKEIMKYNIQLTNIFVGRNILDLQRQWEKIFTYLYLSSSKEEFAEFVHRVIKVISQLEYSNPLIKRKLQRSLAKYFFNTISMVISLNIKQYKKTFAKHIEVLYSKKLKELSRELIIPNAIKVRKSNLIRHYLISILPLSNYCKSSTMISLYGDKYLVKNFKFDLDKKKLKYSPRFIHYHEVSIFYHLKFLYTKKSNNSELYYENSEKFIFNEYKLFPGVHKKNKDYPTGSKKDNSNKTYHNISTKPNKDKLNIALINMRVDVQNSINSFKGKLNLSFDRLIDITSIINTAMKNNADIIIFPEISIPNEWLLLLSEFSKMNNIAIVFGMEHFSIQKRVYNFSVAILPFTVGQYRNSYIHFNQKSYYSPSEEKEIKGNKYKVPFIKNREKVDIYKWKNTVFSIFNCYELSNIKSRSELVGENDFTIAIEYNQDTNYFSNIIGSIARDNHSYIVQVNSSQYGDSRITQPTKTVSMDIVKIKGGKDTSLIIGEIDIKKIRDFQSKTFSLQSEDKNFKLTPPNFKISNYRK